MKGTFNEDGVFMPEGYNPAADYRMAHLDWISKHPNFRKSEYKIPYYEAMKCVHESESSPHLRNLIAFRFWYMDKMFLENQILLDIQMSQICHTDRIVDNDGTNWAFITVGFNEQTITVPQMVAVSANISKFKHFISGKYVLEKFRTNGIHHHTHFLVDLDCKYTPSKLAQDLFKTKGLSKVCMAASYIDVKMLSNKKNKAQPRVVYEQYLEGMKQIAKMACVEKDRVFRKENNIQDAYIF